MINIIYGLISVFLGFVVVICCIRDSDAYFNSKRISFLVESVGRFATRIIHLILGIILVFCGIVMFMGYK